MAKKDFESNLFGALSSQSIDYTTMEKVVK